MNLVMSSYKTVIVSNRLPVNISRVDGELRFEPSSGGLATAMSSLDVEDKIWVGWPGIESDDLTDGERQTITEKLLEHGCVPVFLTAKEVELFYEGYSNDTLWPLFHYFQNVAVYQDDYWQAYQSVNQQFAEAVESVAKPDAKIWVQDYHLMLLPALLRQQMPDSAIGFFLHIPFPSFEIFRLLPQRKEILKGLLGADIVGFHVFDYSQHFADSCARLLGTPVSNGMISYDGRQISSAVYPIGIDYERFRKQLARRATKDELHKLGVAYGNQKLILSIDRLDYSKGIPERLEAFRKLLDQHPEYLGKIKLLMVAVPSRTGVKAYQALRDEIEKTVSRINGTYGTVHWAPISYQFQNRPFSEIVALYARADIMLVTPIRDGMNLVAKEYVASRKRQGGVLILSEMAGAIDELPEALSINPNNSSSVANALHDALVMPVSEQNQRLKVMRDRLSEASVQKWGQDFMSDLEDAAKQERGSRKYITRTQSQNLATEFQRAKRRLIILDYDGTLRSFVKTPSPLAASPTLRIRRVLKHLTDQPDTTVAIVSGRTKRALSGWFVGLPLVLAAEHGAWRRINRRWSQVETKFNEDKPGIIQVVKKYVARTKGSVLEVKDHAVVWHYAAVEPDIAYKRAQELKHELTKLVGDKEISVHEGRNIIETKPSFISKGAVVRDLQQEYQADFVLCAGDDYTDEDMFRQLRGSRGASTIKVGVGETVARFVVEKPTALLDILEQIGPKSSYLLPGIPSQISPRISKWFKR